MKYCLTSATILIILLIGLSAPVIPEPINPEMANIVAQNQINIERLSKQNKQQEIKEKFIEFSISKFQILADPESKKTLAYVFMLKPWGYIVVSIDTDIRPVIAYSYTSDFYFDETPRNILLHILRSDMNKRLNTLNLVSQQLINRNNQMWDSYLNSDSLFLSRMAMIAVYGPLIDTHWDQSPPYNDKCPIDPGSGDRCVTGCVPLAIGQVLNYWEYPADVSFNSSESYTVSVGRVDAPSASMDTIDYNGYCIFPDTSVIADLLFACGVSVRANYTRTATSASVSITPFLSKWRFATGYSMGPSAPTFYSILAQSIKDRKPAPMSLHSSTGSPPGHCVVCDGYKDSGEFHINFGWGGLTDGWYNLPTDRPAGYDIVAQALVNLAAPRFPDIHTFEPITVRVPEDYPTIMDAMINCCAGVFAFAVDTIVLSDGRFTSGGNAAIDFNNSTFVIKSASGAEACTIDCESIGPAFYFRNDEGTNCVIDGLTIINGNTGGIYCVGTSPVIKDCIISNCSGENGGAVSMSFGSNARLYNNIFIDNRSSQLGGGIYCGNGSQPIIKGNIIQRNESRIDGGGVYILDANPIIDGNIIKENEAINGAGFYIKNSSPRIENNMIHDNIATGIGDRDGGGGLYLFNSNALLVNNTITQNEGGFGGGLYCIEHSHPVLLNNIFWENRTLGGGQEIFVKWLSLNYCSLYVAYTNIDQSLGSCIFLSPCIIEWGPGNINNNPDFEDTELHLSSASPCVDRGNEHCVSPFTSDTIWASSKDFERGIRPHGANYDMGADEYGVSYISESKTQTPIRTILTAFPNPFNSSCRIIVPTESKIEILNLSGKCIYKTTVSGSNFNWQPGNQLNSGIYLIKAIKGNKTYSTKVLYLK